MSVGRARPPAAPRARAAGFSLIEVMIVVALAAIIAVLAVPSYQDYVVRSKRSAARAVLMEGAQYLERNYTTAGCYDFANTAACLARSGSATVQPSVLLRAPHEGRQTHEVVWAFGSSGAAYTLTATPCGAAGASCASGAETAFNDATCGALTLTHTGARSSTAGDLGTCWQR